MEIGNLWIIPLSILFNSGLYWLLKHYLVKWYCRRFLSDTAQLECDLKAPTEGVANGTAVNGTANGHVKSSEKEVMYNGKKLVTDGDVNGVSMETVGSVIAAITALVSVIVMIETRHDILKARSSVLVPWCHFAAWYFVVDLYNMFDAYRTRNPVTHLPLLKQYLKFVREKWPYVTHHVVLFSIGYQVVVNDHLRGYKGDFIVATIIGEDFSNPLVNTAKALKLLGQDRTQFYFINGILIVVVFFIVRILNVPFTLLVYAAQYHNWDIVSALLRLRIVCYIAIFLQYILQIYWFVLIIRLGLKSLTKLSQPILKQTGGKKKVE